MKFPAAAAALLVLAVLGVIAASHQPASSSVAGPPMWTNGAFTASTQHVRLAIYAAPRASLSMLDWRSGSTRAAPDERVLGSDFAVEPGVPVEVSVLNYTGDLHTFTVPELGVSFLVTKGAATHPSRTTFTFVPSKRGVFRWFCAMPCGGYMGGNVYAIENEVGV